MAMIFGHPPLTVGKTGRQRECPILDIRGGWDSNLPYCFWLERGRQKRGEKKGKVNQQNPRDGILILHQQQAAARVNSAKRDKLALPKIPSSWPATGPGKHWTAGSGRSCHSSSACRCAPGGGEAWGDTRKNRQLELKEPTIHLTWGWAGTGT